MLESGAMLTRLVARNFRCLRDVDVALSPLTVFVGPNGSGKSTLLDTFRASQMLNTTNQWRHQAGELSVEFFEGAVQMIWAMYDSVQEQRRAQWTLDALHLRLDPHQLRSQNMSAAALTLSASGGNLTNVFDTLHRQTQIVVGKELSRIVPIIEDVEARPTHGGKRQLRFQDRWHKDLWYAPEEVSDGTMLALAFLVLQHMEHAPDLLCIEEPERGLHPYLLEQLVDMLRSLAHGDLRGKPIQVVLATHSAQLLDFCRPEEVRFVSRSTKDGSTVVRAADTGNDDWREAYAEYQEELGAMWLSGALGAV